MRRSTDNRPSESSYFDVRQVTKDVAIVSAGCMVDDGRVLSSEQCRRRRSHRRCSTADNLRRGRRGGKQSRSSPAANTRAGAYVVATRQSLLPT